MNGHVRGPLGMATVGLATILIAAGCGAPSSPSRPTSSNVTSAERTGPIIASACPRGAVDTPLVVDSPTMGGPDRVAVHLTPCTDAVSGPLPVLYLLHGAGADETQWVDIGMLDAVDAAVAGGTFPPAVIAIPDAAAADSGAVDPDELATYLLTEVEPVLAATVSIDAHHRAIGGISRGGGLALAVAGNRPGDFVGVGGHSSVSVPDRVLDAIADAHLRVRLDVGTADSLAMATQQMGDRLAADGADVEVVTSAGGHDRTYWRAHTADYAAFYGSVLSEASAVPSAAEVTPHG